MLDPRRPLHLCALLLLAGAPLGCAEAPTPVQTDPSGSEAGAGGQGGGQGGRQQAGASGGGSETTADGPTTTTTTAAVGTTTGAGGQGSCTPDCTGRVCGTDGCAGSCGQCPAGGDCVDGECTPEGPAEDCSSYPFRAETLLAERVGFGGEVTGGDPDQVYHVTTLAPSGAGSLRAALESDAPYWIVFDVSGTITHEERVRPKSNKTVDGRGRTIRVEGQIQLKDVSNIILSDISVENSLEGHCTQAGDVINTDSAVDNPPGTYTMHDVWIHHVEAWNGGDGLIDLRAGTNYTVSWTHFHTHKKGLIWRNDDDVMRITAHHNFMDRLSLRGPQVVGGQIHFFNNFQFEWFEYGAGSLGGAEFFSEANVYQARAGETCVVCEDPNPCGDTEYFPTPISKAGLVDDWASNGRGYVRSVGDLALEGAQLASHEPDQVFDPSAAYAYVAEPATPELAQRVRDGAGPRVDYCASGVP